MNQNKLFLDVEQKFNEIKEDLTVNQADVFLRYNYFSKKYMGDRLNDVNVGLYLDEGNVLVAQIFVRNKTGYIKEKLMFNREGNKIVGEQRLNYKMND